MWCSTKNWANYYRPKSWNEVVGQVETLDALRSQVLTKQGLNHVYLFSGPSGVGKTTIARQFFNALNCPSISLTGDPCGQYECQCNPDDLWGGLHEFNVAENRGVDDLDEILKVSRTMCKPGVFRGILLDECHLFSAQAWGRLLIPLENPYLHVVWLLLTTDAVPQNIKTRCQVHTLGNISHGEIIVRLQQIAQNERISITDTSLLTIAKHSNDNVREAIHLLQRYSSVGNVDWLLKETKQNDKQNLLNDNQRKIINTVMSMSSQVNHNKLKIGDIKTKLNTQGIDERLIASELRNMKFETRKVKGVTHLLWDMAKLKRIAI